LVHGLSCLNRIHHSLVEIVSGFPLNLRAVPRSPTSFAVGVLVYPARIRRFLEKESLVGPFAHGVPKLLAAVTSFTVLRFLVLDLKQLTTLSTSKCGSVFFAPHVPPGFESLVFIIRIEPEMLGQPSVVPDGLSTDHATA
jgi:hypothetical protein